MTASVIVAATVIARAQQGSLRLYVFDCGTLNTADMGRYRMKPEEVATTKLSIGCYLIVHPRGTLAWDVGAVPDEAWQPTGGPVTQHLVLPDGQMREVVLTQRLLPQFTAAGHPPANVNYLAFSHYHWDHTANANAFARSTWLVRPSERDLMFGGQPASLGQPSTFALLRNATTKAITSDEYDVFGDGSVVMKLAAGHTAGHQVLFLRLPKTGNIVLSGDLYHYPEERTLNRIPTFEVDEAKTRASRADIDAFLARNRAQLWVQHDIAAYAKLKKAPQYYD